MGIPLNATENAALAITPAASTFHRWRGETASDKGLGAAASPAKEEFMGGSISSPNHPENHIISNLQSTFSA
ncbi:hypothetical protein [Delftia tsuruhatensis]|uniref:hypothetical protein n=1 Tax=Delftia tsuruhatensis TaxID=180282 RepID=UPI001F2134CE|nr:hypothetical protein [Delftia tsuruhatensis]